MEHSEEILNVKCLGYSLLSWARSVLANDQAIKWAKASRSTKSMELYSRQNGATIQRIWSSCVQKYQCIESWNLEAEKEKVPFITMEMR